MENPTQYIVDEIQNNFLNSSSIPTKKRNATSLIKVHDNKLNQLGDISFPLSIITWRKYFNVQLSCKGTTIFSLIKSTSDEESRKIFQQHAQNWIFPVAEVKLVQDRCALFLQRKHVTESLLHEVLNGKKYGFQTKQSGKQIHIKDYQSINSVILSEYRAALVFNVLKKLVKLSNWNEVNDDMAEGIRTINIVSIATKSTTSEQNKLVTAFKIGVVLDPNDGKKASISADEYKRIRSTDMRLMAMHKYGIRVKDDKKFCALFERLGEAAVTVDLLEVKPSSPVHMIKTGQGSTKGASFILYNSARLETLLRSFNERVENGVYEKLPPLSDIDFSLLSSEEEWALIHGYIFAFPNLICRCIEGFDLGYCGIHYLIKFLEGLVSTFSVYYRRIRILTETRAHLMPHIYARIYFLTAIRDILNRTLALLEIEPVQFM